MLQICSKIASKRANDPGRGNVQQFLERLLVEVVADNYRYFLAQRLWYEEEPTKEGTDTWTPLLNGEREVSGLFAAALSRVSPISSPEFPIDRLKSSGDDEALSGGRVDYVACFGNREVGIELKQHGVSTNKSTKPNKGLLAKWQAVKKQSTEVLKYMRTGKYFQKPVSVGLLVIRLECKLNKNIKKNDNFKADIEEACTQAEEVLVEYSDKLIKTLRPSFLAYYKAPREMQISCGWGAEEDEYRLYPGIIFVAVVRESTKRSNGPSRANMHHQLVSR